MPGDPTATTPPPDHLLVGRLGRPFQLEGGIRLIVTDPAGSAALDSVERVFVPGFGAAAVRRLRLHGREPVVYLEGVRDRDAAAALTGRELFAAPAGRAGAGPDDRQLPAAPPLLTGLPVLFAGAEVGRVVEVRFAGVNPVAVVAAGTREVLVPLSAPYVEVTAERIELVDPPEGLLEPA